MTMQPESARADRRSDGGNEWLEQAGAKARVEWALESLPGTHVLTSSFGAQSAVMLHLVNTVAPGIPVVLIDTGYLFPETYRLRRRTGGKTKPQPQGISQRIEPGLAGSPVRPALGAGRGSTACLQSRQQGRADGACARIT